MSPSRLTHSCVFVYFRFSGADISLSFSALCIAKTLERLCASLIKGRLHLHRISRLAANHDLERFADAGDRPLDQRKANVLFQRWRKGATGDLADLFTI